MRTVLTGFGFALLLAIGAEMIFKLLELMGIADTQFKLLAMVVLAVIAIIMIVFGLMGLSKKERIIDGGVIGEEDQQKSILKRFRDWWRDN